jgi:DNA-binding GntR family transcriptional regulator
MARGSRGATRADDVFLGLRADILGGRRPPGSRVVINAVGDEYAVSISVVREALNRLVQVGLVASEAHQGYLVTPLSEVALVDLTMVRIEIETLCLRLSVKHGDVEWESRLLAAAHRLERQPAVMPDDPQNVEEEWASLHRHYHEVLAEACCSPTLVALRAPLYDRAEVYRRWSLPAGGETRDTHREHREIVDAAIERDAELACQRLQSHIQGTTDILLRGRFTVESSPVEPSDQRTTQGR